MAKVSIDIDGYIYDEDTVNKIMSENYIEQNTEAMNLDEIVIGNTKEKTHYSSEYEKELAKLNKKIKSFRRNPCSGRIRYERNRR